MPGLEAVHENTEGIRAKCKAGCGARNDPKSLVCRNRLRGNEIFLKTARVSIEQLLNSLVAVGLQNETRVVILRDAVSDFGSVYAEVSGCSWRASERMTPA